MEQQLIDALQQIRTCRNNMTKEDFFSVLYEVTTDNNILVPLMELSTVCTTDRLIKNVNRLLGDVADR